MDVKNENYQPDLIQKAVLAYYLNNVTETIKQQDIPFVNLYGLGAHDQAFNKRMEAIREGKKEKVNFNSIVKRTMKSAFVEYSSIIPYDDTLHFVKDLTDKAQLIIEFEKFYQGGGVSVGKTFTINLLLNISVAGSRTINSGYKNKPFGRNLFNFLGSLEEYYWTYVSANDLEKSLVEIINLLKKVLPFLESLPITDIARVNEKCPNFISVRGPMTARQGIKEATTLTKSWANDALLKQINGSEVGIDGISRSNGGWMYRYSSKTKDKSLWVTIPFLGLPNFKVFNSQSKIILQSDESLEIEWIDSDHVGFLLLGHLQNLVGASDKSMEAGFVLEHDPPRYKFDFPIWRTSYSILHDKINKNRKYWYLTIDARDGRIVEEKNS